MFYLKHSLDAIILLLVAKLFLVLYTSVSLLDMMNWDEIFLCAWILGQPIPKGLHIRYNLQTGHTEAKILDEDHETTNDDANYRKSTSLSNGKEFVIYYLIIIGC